MRSLSQQQLRAAALYFVDGLDQSAVAQEMGLSRSGVSRLLQQARARGLVALEPRIPGTALRGLAALLAEHYGLKDVLIIQGEASRQAIGEAAAHYLQTALRPGVTIGISWGTADLIAALEPTPVRNSRVVQLAGGV